MLMLGRALNARRGCIRKQAARNAEQDLRADNAVVGAAVRAAAAADQQAKGHL